MFELLLLELDLELVLESGLESVLESEKRLAKVLELKSDKFHRLARRLRLEHMPSHWLCKHQHQQSKPFHTNDMTLKQLKHCTVQLNRYDLN